MKKYILKQVVPKNKSEELIDLIIEIERAIMKQDKYWNISYIPSANACSIYISSEKSEDDE